MYRFGGHSWAVGELRRCTSEIEWHVKVYDGTGAKRTPIGVVSMRRELFVVLELRELLGNCWVKVSTVSGITGWFELSRTVVEHTERVDNNDQTA